VDQSLQSLGQITDVSADAALYLKQKYFKRLVVVGAAVAVAEILWFAYLFASGNFSQATLEVALIPLFAGGAVYSFVKNKVEDAFLQQFAAAQGFTFQEHGLPQSLDGTLFSLGHSTAGRDLVSGSFQGMPLCLFNYQYTVGYGKGSHTYDYTIFQLDYPDPLPPVFLQVVGFNFGEGALGYFSKNDPEKIQLEGDFNKYFTLYTKKGFETETLQILSPDFMVKVQDVWKNFSLELVADHLYIYSYHVIGTKVELDSMYELAQYLVERIEPLAARMKTTLTALEGYYGGGK
jgi:hypothetical protein